MHVLPPCHHHLYVLGSGVRPGSAMQFEVLLPPNMTIHVKAVDGWTAAIGVHGRWPAWALMEEVSDGVAMWQMWQI